MGRAPCCEKDSVKRGPWTPEEDAKLLACIGQHGTGSWRTLPKKAGLQRCGKSCRLRWTNYLRPDLKHGRFSEQEEQLIVKLHAALGSRWSLIAAQLPGRTDNDVKNYWNTRLKKKLCEMGIDPITHKPISQLLADLAGSVALHKASHMTTSGGGAGAGGPAGPTADIADATLGCFKDDMLNVLLMHHKRSSAISSSYNRNNHNNNNYQNSSISINPSSNDNFIPCSSSSSSPPSNSPHFNWADAIALNPGQLFCSSSCCCATTTVSEHDPHPHPRHHHRYPRLATAWNDDHPHFDVHLDAPFRLAASTSSNIGAPPAPLSTATAVSSATIADHAAAAAADMEAFAHKIKTGLSTAITQTSPSRQSYSGNNTNNNGKVISSPVAAAPSGPVSGIRSASAAARCNNNTTCTTINVAPSPSNMVQLLMPTVFPKLEEPNFSCFSADARQCQVHADELDHDADPLRHNAVDGVDGNMMSNTTSMLDMILDVNRSCSHDYNSAINVQPQQDQKAVPDLNLMQRVADGHTTFVQALLQQPFDQASNKQQQEEEEDEEADDEGVDDQGVMGTMKLPTSEAANFNRLSTTKQHGTDVVLMTHNTTTCRRSKVGEDTCVGPNGTWSPLSCSTEPSGGSINNCSGNTDRNVNVPSASDQNMSSIEGVISSNDALLWDFSELGSMVS